jgi:hypothetical protein
MAVAELTVAICGVRCRTILWAASENSSEREKEYLKPISPFVEMSRLNLIPSGIH